LSWTTTVAISHFNLYETDGIADEIENGKRRSSAEVDLHRRYLCVTCMKAMVTEEIKIGMKATLPDIRLNSGGRYRL